MSPELIDFVTGAPVTGAAEPVWIHGAPRNRRCTDPPIQVHQHDPHTWLLRQSKAVNYEAPFMFLLFGNERALLLDTGATADPALFPLRRTVDGLVDRWLADHPRPGYRLIVAHTHGHGDHVQGDAQFADRPDTEVVDRDEAAVHTFFGFTGWPHEVVTLDLGGRVLEVTGIPGHHAASVAVYDRWTGLLLSGDTILPGRLYVQDYPAFVASLDHLAAFTAARPVTAVLGCHIEMTRRPGRDYPLGCTYQPAERPLALPPERVAEIRDAAHAASQPGAYVHDDYIIWHGFGPGLVRRQRARYHLGRVANLVRPSSGGHVTGVHH